MTDPILVFDSGIGGLSVLSEIRKQLPQQDFIYLFDNARLPYGELEEADLKNGAIRLIVDLVEKHRAKMAVIACNTASTIILPELRECLSIPVVGVVPAIKPASEQTQTQHIAVIATPATIKRDYTKNLIDTFASNCKVELLASSELVRLAEQKLSGGEILQSEVRKIVKPIVNTNVDTLVLGCTHFPLLKEELNLALNKRVKLLDSGTAIAKRIMQLLNIDSCRESLSERTGTASRVNIIGVHTTDSIDAGLDASLRHNGFTKIEPYKKAR
ncbi:glutamate racemase [Shewanella sp. 202IG2-18]|uniref:glutamate racemase n=1 Tax=Parashewanella hymeniacidonis TaxID=2807618 RepID=UPI00195F8F7C|nr:glutamate racemase [Parashewanella hymeniacidonis]MBM7071128.1 glutamate racemase [Parashewanella hymeniacidonis]